MMCYVIPVLICWSVPYFRFSCETLALMSQGDVVIAVGERISGFAVSSFIQYRINVVLPLENATCRVTEVSILKLCGVYFFFTRFTRTPLSTMWRPQLA